MSKFIDILPIFCIFLSVIVIRQQTCAFSFRVNFANDNDSTTTVATTSSTTTVPPPLPESESFVPKLDKENEIKKCDPCPTGIRCVPPIQCPAYIRAPPNKRPQKCDLPGGHTHGYCCTSGQNHTFPRTAHANLHRSFVLKHSSDAHTDTNEIDDPHSHFHQHKHLQRIIQEARSAFAQDVRMEKQMIHQRIAKNSPEFFHNLVFRSSSQSLMQSIDLSQRAIERVYASRILKKREHISTEDFELNYVDAYLDDFGYDNTCHYQPPCPLVSSRYRSQDGICNNQRHPKWGSSGAPMARLLPPSYEDGIWEPRTFSRDGSRLPNARTISRELLHDVDRPHHLYNLLFMQFGQFLTHDVTQSASITTGDGSAVNCCSEDGSAISNGHYSCYAIEIEGYDDFYSQFGQKCINFVRSALSPDDECKLGYGKQLSKVTHYIDASPVYGSDAKMQSDVRQFSGGLLRMFNDFGRPMLPLTNDKDSCGSQRDGCFFAGDGRSNQIITLTVLHTLFAREHNRIATALRQINPHWNDDQLFYETRTILIAKFQFIVYNEWLPYLIGTETMERFGLNVKLDGYATDYDIDVNAEITSEFSTAAFRFGHSTVDGKFIVHQGNSIDEIIGIPDVMFNSARLRRPHFYDEILNTLTQQPMQQVDSAITLGLSKYLFRGDNPFGLDLAAINIQRGRDHGVRCYNDYLETTGYSRVTDFREFGHEIGQKLARVYKHPDDIDLWVGGLLEAARGDGILGPTFSDMIADQFSRFRRGDRYFFENSPDINPAFFTLEQLQEIRHTSMARIICDNTDGLGLHAIAPKAFVRPDLPGNYPVPCNDYNSIPIVNYQAWQEL